MVEFGKQGPYLPSDELDGLALGTAEEERRRAKGWMDSSAEFLANAEFWRGEAQRLYRLMKRVNAIAEETLRTYGISLYMVGADEVRERIKEALLLIESRVDGKMADPDGPDKEVAKPDPIRAKIVEELLEKTARFYLGLMKDPP
jgi:hypothetical protein